MKIRKILFTSPNVAELVEGELPDTLGDNQALVKTEFTAVSAGTERANLIGEINISGVRAACNDKFPRQLGYSGVGIVEKTGSRVTRVKPGDRVIIYFGKHQTYNVMSESSLFPIPDSVSSEEASFVVIAGFSAEGVRKTRLEFGESALVMGLGILGLYSVQICRTSGAVPVIAADPNPERRALALKLGADHALSPLADGFIDTVRELTNGRGVDVVVEVTGIANALVQALDCTAQFGRVTLLGCTRTPDTYDLYHQVHYPGVMLIGANNFARPRYESRPGNWTAADDCAALLKGIAGGRLNFRDMISEVHAPAEAPEVYHRLAFDREFPIGVLFDWKKDELF